MDEVYAARYRWSARQWQVLQAPALYTWLRSPKPGPACRRSALAGTAWTAFGVRLMLPAAWPRCGRKQQDRAGALLRLALQAAQAGEGVDAADALPLYLRDKVALTTDERAAVKAAAAASS